MFMKLETEFITFLGLISQTPSKTTFFKLPLSNINYKRQQAETCYMKLSRTEQLKV